jgi:hypothetical protein
VRHTGATVAQVVGLTSVSLSVSVAPLVDPLVKLSSFKKKKRRSAPTQLARPSQAAGGSWCEAPASACLLLHHTFHVCNTFFRAAQHFFGVTVRQLSLPSKWFCLPAPFSAFASSQSSLYLFCIHCIQHQPIDILIVVFHVFFRVSVL